jgi:methylated-DNA-[protein]-cysteine S-methyltransferase
MTIPVALDARFREAAASAGLLDAAFDLADSPLGTLLVAATDRGLCQISYDPDRGLEELSNSVGRRVLRVPRRLATIRRELDEYFERRRTAFDLKLDLSRRPEFQQRVLRRLALVPYGNVTTYGALAASIGNPRAARAIGGAMHRNPIPIVLPCHRVVGAGGKLVGYAGGLDRKQALLSLEAPRSGRLRRGFEVGAAAQIPRERRRPDLGDDERAAADPDLLTDGGNPSCPLDEPVSGRRGHEEDERALERRGLAGLVRNGHRLSLRRQRARNLRRRRRLVRSALGKVPCQLGLGGRELLPEQGDPASPLRRHVVLTRLLIRRAALGAQPELLAQQALEALGIQVTVLEQDLPQPAPGSEVLGERGLEVRLADQPAPDHQFAEGRDAVALHDAQYRRFEGRGCPRLSRPASAGSRSPTR